jgi:hypothetical protein
MSAMNDAPGKSALDTTISLTYFTDHTGIYATPDRTTLRALIPKLTNTTAASKAALPWTKLAQFGQQRTEKSSLRHNANVLAIHGVEADYDGEQITLDSARRVMADAGLAAILYTSPSHTAAKPRWRILCPTSVPHPPAERSRFLARVNGLFAGALSAESFTLSQSYYYGRVGDAPDHEVVAVDGGHIDHADHLDAQAVGRPGKEQIPYVPAAPSAAILGQPTGCTKYGMVALEGECNAIRMAGDGMKHHAVNKSAYSVGGLVSSGQLIQSIAWAALTDALSTIAGQCKDFGAAQKTLEQAFAAGIGAPRNVPDRGRPNLVVIEQHPPAEIDDDGYRASLHRSAMEQAEDHGPDVGFQDFVERVEPPAEKAPADPDNIWRAIYPSIFHRIAVPERQWIVENWLPKRQVTLNYADGGIGKTLLAMQLQASTALGSTWCGLAVEQCRSLGLYSEDDTTELHIRLDAIRRHHDVEFTALDDMVMVDGTGQDNLLVVWEGQRLVATPRFIQLREHALDVGARLIVVDTAATTFGGNEIDRAQVTQFVGTYLTKLAQDIDGAVLLNAHPSLSGMSSGNMTSGSTAWNGSARSRWAITRPEGEDGKPKLDSPERVITRRKSNGAAAGATITMEWVDGVFKVPGWVMTGQSGARKDNAEAAFLNALRASPRPVIDNKQAGNYAPRVFYATPQARDFNPAELAEAMRNLLSRGVIEVREYTQNYRTAYQLSIVEREII